MEDDLKVPTKHEDGTWMYSSKHILKILRKMPDSRKAKILYRAINIMEKDNRPMIYGIAKAMGCWYDDMGFWKRKTKIKIAI